MIFRYIIVGLIIYWIGKRVFRISSLVKNNGESPDKSSAKHSTKKVDKHGGDYVDYEEVE
ncbi:hypothetical protein OAD66_02850 [Bacteroidia bacterium]|nr:hypothetical protein [Bacteroidia bacterium]MDB9882051.1 hypothetical protein [Bacteroidia bacterium]